MKVAVGAGVSVAVGSGVSVGSGVPIAVGAGGDVAVGSGVPATVGSSVGVEVAVGVVDGSGVRVEVGVGGDLAVGSTVGVGVDVDVAVGCGVRVVVADGEGVGVAVASRTTVGAGSGEGVTVTVTMGAGVAVGTGVGAPSLQAPITINAAQPAAKIANPRIERPVIRDIHPSYSPTSARFPNALVSNSNPQTSAYRQPIRLHIRKGGANMPSTKYAGTLTSKERTLRALAGEPVDRPPVTNPTNVTTVELMDLVEAPFPTPTATRR